MEERERKRDSGGEREGKKRDADSIREDGEHHTQVFAWGITRQGLLVTPTRWVLLSQLKYREGQRTWPPDGKPGQVEWIQEPWQFS